MGSKRRCRCDDKESGNLDALSQSPNSLPPPSNEWGDKKKALELYEQALQIDEAIFGSNHPNVARDLDNLGRLLCDLKLYEEARAIYERALHIQEAVFGPEHPQVANVISNLGNVLWRLDELEAARVAYERALHIHEAHSPDYPDVATALGQLGFVRFLLGDREGARAAIQRSIHILKRSLSPDDPRIFWAMESYGPLLRKT